MADSRQSGKLAVILHADIAGSTTLVQQDEHLAHERIQETFRRFGDIIGPYQGRVRELRGDALLAEFDRASGAVCAALAFQEEQANYIRRLKDGIQPAVRVGIAMGEVVIADNTITGAGVVLAQRLEQLAEPGGMVIQSAARDTIPNRFPFVYTDLGEHQVKGFDQPVQAYGVTLQGEATIPKPEKEDNRLRIGVMALVSIAVIAAGAALLWLKPWETRGGLASVERMAYPLPDKPSIAVLPFNNMSDDKEQEYFVDGMTEDLITDLAKLSGLFVIARNSVFAYKDKSVMVNQVAEELGVRYVLEGSVRRVENKIRINAQLVDTTTGGHLWAERFDRDYSNIFSLQDEVISKIIDAMAVKLTSSEESSLGRIPTDNLEAYDYFLRAEQKAYGSIMTVNVALDLYQKAIDLDPDFAEAHAGYARTTVDIWRLNYDNFITNPVAQKLTYEAASRALELDPSLARAYTVLGFLQLFERAYDEAVASGRRAVELGPNSADAHLNLGLILAYAGQTKDAVNAVVVAQRLDPDLSPRNLVEAGFIYFTNREPEKALKLLEMARQFLPDNERVMEYLSGTYARAGRMDEARSEMSKLISTFPFQSLEHARTYYAYYKHDTDLEYYLGAMKDAGMPEWPFGFEGNPRDRMAGREIGELLFGRLWRGTINRSQQFFQETSIDGEYAYRSGTSFVVGRASVEDEKLCLQSEITNLGRKQCGYVYRSPDGNNSARNEYIYVHPYFLMTFSTE